MHNKKFHQGCAGIAALLLSQIIQAAPACAPETVQKGAQVFSTECSVCHAVQPNVQGLIGPNLKGVVGRTSGTLPGFTYSQAMRDRAKAWDVEGIAAFIAQPQAAVPGTYMPYMGLADAASRDAVACFLSQQH